MVDELIGFPYPPDELRSGILSRVDELTMLPAIALEALDLAKDPDCAASEIAAVIEQDLKLATEVLSLCNSATFSGCTPVHSITQAIARLGQRQCINLILTSCVSSVMKRLPLEREWIREVLWRHSFVTATTSAHLNRVLGLDFEGEEFTAGLLHDLGRLLMAVAEPGLFTSADPLDFQESDQLLVRERDIVGTDHCRCGAWFARRAGLPEDLVVSMLHHHAPQMAQVSQALTCLVAAADHIANHLQIHEGPAEYQPEENQGIVCLSKLTDPGLVDTFVHVSDTLLASICADVQSSSLAKMGTG